MNKLSVRLREETAQEHHALERRPDFLQPVLAREKGVRASPCFPFDVACREKQSVADVPPSQEIGRRLHGGLRNVCSPNRGTPQPATA